MKIRKEWKELVPGLSPDEQEILRADIEANGVLVPIVVDEVGFILDGMHRYTIDQGKTAKHRSIKGLSETEKVAYVLAANTTRRNLSPEQMREVGKRKQETARALKEENPKLTQAEIGVALGVARNTVSEWFSSVGPDIAKPPPANQKVSTTVREEIVEREASGETGKDLAAEFKITPGRVSQLKRQATAAAREDQKDKRDSTWIHYLDGHLQRMEDLIEFLDEMKPLHRKTEETHERILSIHNRWMEVIALVNDDHPDTHFQGIENDE